jgi:hypothetical protein
LCFFDSQGIVYKEFVEEGCTVNAEYCKGVLNRLISRIRRIRPALYRTRDIFLLHDNAPAHSAAMIRQFLALQKVAMMQPPPPILTKFGSRGLFLLPKVKLQLKVARFDTITAIQKAVTGKLQAIPAEEFSNVMKKLQTRGN